MFHTLKPLLPAIALLVTASQGNAQSAISYQGRLKQAEVPITGTCDLTVALWDTVTGGQLVAGPLTITNVAVDKGLFSIAPDFGTGVWDGSPRFLEIAVRSPAGSGSYATLTPRQQVTPAPYALHAVEGGPWEKQGTTLQYGPISITDTNLIGINVPNPSALIQLNSFQGTDSASPVRFNFGGAGGSAIEVVRNQDSLTPRTFQILGRNSFDSFASFSVGMVSAHPLGLMTAGTIRMVIDENGRAAIGTQSTDPNATLRLTATNGVALRVDGAITSPSDVTLQGSSMTLLQPTGGWGVKIGTAGGEGNLEITGHAYKPSPQLWEPASDRRLKENVAPLTSALETVSRIRPVTFHYRQSWCDRYHLESSRAYYGIIAQEFASVFPECVSEGPFELPDSDERGLVVDTSPLVFVSIAAIQELAARQDALEEQVHEQRERLAKLESDRSEIESLRRELAELRQLLARQPLSTTTSD